MELSLVFPFLPVPVYRQVEADRIVAGQMVSVFIDQKDLLEEILGAIKKS
ncbi:MAG: hypothetical protein WA277_05185 [Nitrospirota bacterium]